MTTQIGRQKYSFFLIYATFCAFFCKKNTKMHHLEQKSGLFIKKNGVTTDSIRLAINKVKKGLKEGYKRLTLPLPTYSSHSNVIAIT